MAYSRYATEMKDGDNNIYGLMDEEARAQLSDLNSAINDRAGQLETAVFVPVGDTQIFNKFNVIISNVKCNSSNNLQDSKKIKTICIPYSVTGGEVFYGKYLGTHTYSEYGISEMTVFVTNTLEAGQAVVKKGSTNYTSLSGNISVSSGSTATYLCFSFMFDTENHANEFIADLINYFVVNKNVSDYATSYIDYYTSNVVNSRQGVEYYGNFLVVDETGKVVATPLSNVPMPNYVKKVENKTVGITDDRIPSATITAQTGWTDNGDGSYTHASGSTSSLRCLLGSLSASTPYLVVYTVTNPKEAELYCRLGANNNRVDGYNGTTTMAVGFVTSDDVTTTANKYLDFTPISSFVGTISNIHCYKIDPSSNTTYQLPFWDNIGIDRPNNITGFWNAALSQDGLQKSPNGTRNVCVGYRSMYSFNTGSRNVAVGSFTMSALQKGERNVAIGADALYLATEANDCVAIGKNAMINGNSSLVDNVAIGNNAMGNNKSDAVRNVAIGRMAGHYAGNDNTAVGYQSGYWTKGNGNVSVGSKAGVNNFITGDNNVAIGYQSGITASAGASSANPDTTSGTIAIGHNAKATKSDQMVLGSDEITEVVMCGNKKIVFNQDGSVSWEPVS